METDVVVHADPLRHFCRDLFRRAGLPADWAEIEAEILVWADLRGVGSHGVLRVPSYLRWIGEGLRRPDASMRAIVETEAITVLEADRGPGLVAMRRAMEMAIERARKTAIGWVLVRETSHTGALGYYVRQATDAGMIGLATCSSRPLMTYHGARVPALGTSPIAIGVPRAGMSPLVLDMSSAAIPFGKLAEARQRGTPLPEGVALDDAGRPTTDPNAAAVSLPLAGAKGSGLALMIECLTSLLVGRPLLASALEDAAEAVDFVQNALVVAINPAIFPGGPTLAEEVDRLARDLSALPRAEGVAEILMPGERGDAVAARRRVEGIPIPAGVWSQLQSAAARLGVTPPEPAASGAA